MPRSKSDKKAAANFEEDLDDVVAAVAEADAKKGIVPKVVVAEQTSVNSNDLSLGTAFSVAAVAIAAVMELQIFHLYAPQELIPLVVIALVAAVLLSLAVKNVTQRRFNALKSRKHPVVNMSGKATWYSISLNTTLFFLGVWFFHGYTVPNVVYALQSASLADNPYVDVIPTLLATTGALAAQSFSKKYFF